MPIEAVLDTVEMSLKDVLNLKVGSRILLNVTSSSEVQLVCGDLPMFTGKMGRKGGHIAIRISEKIEKDRGLAP